MLCCYIALRRDQVVEKATAELLTVFVDWNVVARMVQVDLVSFFQAGHVAPYVATLDVNECFPSAQYIKHEFTIIQKIKLK